MASRFVCSNARLPSRCVARGSRRVRLTTNVSDATPELLDAFTAGYEPIVEIAPSEHVRVDTSGTVDGALAQAKREIATWPRGSSGSPLARLATRHGAHDSVEPLVSPKGSSALRSASSRVRSSR